ncbi:prostaglandin F2 receptor negative regulator isoform X1 [Tachysurus vachellii]|uniref:prostaglandin F2 receptor negative regulator isoform X1 n=1 Tax=Tachysurus vachellii TaxID=175792 RepID=UPI00296ACC70|nr:prostaglandin F2 receptor negative regulator isoform X1 [Tachysurus vachellii]
MCGKGGQIAGITHRQDMKSLLVLITLCFIIGLTVGRKVLLPTGPLIRVEGETLSLRCEVSDYQGPKEQDFEWKAINGSKTIRVVSTFDPSFPDQSLKSRVYTGDISVERISESTVDLRIKEARVTDSGTFTCSTPSTDSVISGNYEADVLLRVIRNTLVVVPEVPAPSVHESRSINLHCNITQDFTEGVYLSITWSVKKNQSLEQDLLTFGPDSGLIVGKNFTQRYADGEICLHMNNTGSYSLVLSSAVPEDQGIYLCTAKQWSREQGTWTMIQEKAEVIGEVAVIPAAESLIVQVLDSTILKTGDNLNLTCLVSAYDLAALDLEVTWLLNETHILTHLSRDGVVAKTSDIFSINQVGEGDFRLEIHSVELSDKGLYLCRVRAWIQQSRGKWYQAAEKTSAPVQVLITPQDPTFTVTFKSPVIAQYVGDPTELVCQVSNISQFWGKRLSVCWFYSVASSDGGHVGTDVIASLNENGAIIPSDKYRDRIDSGLILVTRIEPATFKLRLLHTTNADVGEYVCSVATWTLTRLGIWKHTSEQQTHGLKVSLASKGPGISVIARHIRQATFSGSTFEMNCLAKLKNLWDGVSLSVHILVQYGVGAPSRKLASLSPDLVLKLEDWYESSRQDSLSLVKTGNMEFIFRIQGVQMMDRGFYYCEVAAWTKPDGKNWVEMTKGESNKIQINFEHTRPTFDLSIMSDTTSVYPWETVKIDCIITVSGTSNTDNVAYEIRWYHGSHFQGSGSFVLLTSIDHLGVVRKSPRNDTSDCSLERLRTRTFTLTIHGTQDSDAGEYYCTATPWIRSTTKDNWSKEPEIISKRFFLNVKFALWDSMKLPLLYGTCTSLTMGLFSLILGLLCTLCCCRNTTHTKNPPHTRIKLINPQND